MERHVESVDLNSITLETILSSFVRLLLDYADVIY